MNLMQLTFIVAVSMMVPASCCRPTWPGAISLLSGSSPQWLLAIAYGFAQAGVNGQRPGGMAAYAEEPTESGYFQVFLLPVPRHGNARSGSRQSDIFILPGDVGDTGHDLHQRDRSCGSTVMLAARGYRKNRFVYDWGVILPVVRSR
jgi:hypothetical protein